MTKWWVYINTPTFLFHTSVAIDILLGPFSLCPDPLQTKKSKYCSYNKSRVNETGSEVKWHAYFRRRRKKHLPEDYESFAKNSLHLKLSGWLYSGLWTQSPRPSVINIWQVLSHTQQRPSVNPHQSPTLCKTWCLGAGTVCKDSSCYSSLRSLSLAVFWRKKKANLCRSVETTCLPA